MPILDIQRGLREVGRIRCGDQVATQSGKTAPRKLEHFRITSDDKALIEEIADLYGGEVTKWEGAPVGDQWQVYTTAERIPVVIAPGLAAITQWRELWTGGGCVRRCDSQTEQITKSPCICAAQGEMECKPTTRLSVILPEVPGLGVWRLESHGYYAARELGGQMALVDQVVRTGQVVVASLRLTFREDRKPGQPIKKYLVPSLDVSATFAQLAQAAAGQVGIIDGSATMGGELYQPNGAAIARDAARAALPNPASVQQADERRQAQQAKKRTSKSAKPDLGTGRQRIAGIADTVAPPDGEPPAETSMMQALTDAFAAARVPEPEDRRAFCAAIAGRPLASAAAMTADEGTAVLEALYLVIAETHSFVMDPATMRPVGIELLPASNPASNPVEETEPPS